MGEDPQADARRSAEVRVTNETAKRIAIAEADTGSHRPGLILAPFASQRVPVTLWDSLNYRPWCDHGLITARVVDDGAARLHSMSPLPAIMVDSSERNVIRPNGALAFGLAFWVGILWFVADMIPAFGEYYLVRALVDRALLIIAVLVLGGLLWSGRDRIARVSGAIERHFGTFAAGIRFCRRWLSRMALVVMLLGVGLGVPAMLGVVLIAPAAMSGLGLPPIPAGAAVQVVQLVFVAVASFTPGVLYFLFGSERLAAVRDRFIQDVMMLDPGVYTTQEAVSKYGAVLEEVLGTLPSDGRGGYGYRLLGSGWPVIISTVLITLGWLLALPLIIQPATPANDPFLLFEPQRKVFVFGFLGAYFFALNMVFRRYVRADLAPKAYSHIVVRIFASTIIVWVVALLPAEAGGGSEDATWVLLALAFCVGIFPETGLTLINDALRRLGWQVTRSASLQEDHPLTKLEGMNLYDQARLLEEGIENVENLAHHNLVGLMLRTRIATPRLVDLVDQAILYLHVGANDASGAAMRQLRDHGVRTATALERVAHAAARRVPDAPDQVLCALGPCEPGRLPRLRVVLDALQEEEWMPFLRHWRASRGCGSERPWSYEDFYAVMRFTPPIGQATSPAGPGPTSPRQSDSQRPHAPSATTLRPEPAGRPWTTSARSKSNANGQHDARGGHKLPRALSRLILGRGRPGRLPGIPPLSGSRPSDPPNDGPIRR